MPQQSPEPDGPFRPGDRGLDVRVTEARLLSADARGALIDLFNRSYRQANVSYLEKSLDRLRYVAMAVRRGVLVGFALGDTRALDLPHLPAQTVALAGIACIVPELRRQGLFRELGRLAITTAPVPPHPRLLVCGRMAHPAAMRTIGRIPTVVPRAGLRPTPWQQDVGRAIAEAYGVYRFDPATFVCIGDGRPIGYPRVDVDVEPEEWEIFQRVDRDRGDALLAIGWVPDAPPDW